MTVPSWYCVQEGHREYYGIPRALHRVGALERLVTDVWASPNSWTRWLPQGRLSRRLRDRHHREIPSDRVKSFPLHTLAWESLAAARGRRGAERTLARNRWWDRLSARALRRGRSSATGCVFAYCYGARELFVQARRLGLRPVLGQIDPGPVEDRKVTALAVRWREYRGAHRPGSDEYYSSWREECRLAEHIVVNSEWSRRALLEAGVPNSKIVVCPLAYVPPPEAAEWERRYPDRFSRERPLHALFLGQCILRKGIAETIEAARRMKEEPVEFTFVGNTDISDFESHLKGARIRRFPRLSRGECQAFFREADVFLFPTHSDGFGLTQLEAQAWRLPIIATAFCGDVVEPGRTGWVLPEVSGEAIAAVLREILDRPAELARRSAAIRPWSVTLDDVGRLLKGLEAAQ